MENVKRVCDFLDETKCYFLATMWLRVSGELVKTNLIMHRSFKLDDYE